MRRKYRASGDLMANHIARQHSRSSSSSFRAGAPRPWATAPKKPSQIRADSGDFPQGKPEGVGDQRTPAALRGQGIALAERA